MASHYEGVVAELIHRLKYDGIREAAPALARMLEPMLRSEEFDVVTAVPAPPSRRRARGFNQAELIARSVSRALDLPFSPLLSRHGRVHQVGATRQQRLANIQGVFYPRGRRSLSGQRVLIIDDVLTTGATLNEAAKVLKNMGAKTVWGGVIAKR